MESPAKGEKVRDFEGRIGSETAWIARFKGGWCFARDVRDSVQIARFQTKKLRWIG
jgi:hypothetical protein